VVERIVAACCRNRPIEHKQYIDKHGEDMPEILNWKWNDTK
jgi:xylulose-5-phosphate/fructose-6-phosphate phosphoketolase